MARPASICGRISRLADFDMSFLQKRFSSTARIPHRIIENRRKLFFCDAALKRFQIEGIFWNIPLVHTDMHLSYNNKWSNKRDFYLVGTLASDYKWWVWNTHSLERSRRRHRLPLWHLAEAKRTSTNAVELNKRKVLISQCIRMRT